MRDEERPLAVVLAGGLARRMGGSDKPLLLLGGRPVLDHVLARLRPQVSGLALNANGDPARFSDFGLPVLPDPLPGWPGPLAGILAALDWAAAAGAGHVLTVPGDTPFLPADLVEQLGRSVADGAAAAFATSAGRRHPIVGLWPVAARDALRHGVADAGMRRVDDWARSLDAVPVEFPIGAVDPFFNVNTPEDLRTAESLLGL
ncbi:molybdenum cofactor guanylyltransferase [Aliidongia dinghuensis]|uniref:Molybdenum cofactor guanylyltransferase n=1 Tax=Aliidongia dinghuensis TaxID=1867774 RepID=A0A8J3E5U3_9PROT|nr:molybdenum cofactor guanylyltransferase MobA [Aliidongia dinghuensis]GGF35354.1 molybdenum cofactor guanylyltransferase [Aliidongia dinghuensis]